MSDIKTNIYQKSMFRFCIARYLGLGTPMCYEFLGQFVNYMINDKKIKKYVEDKLENKFDPMMKTIRLFDPIYNYMGQLDKLKAGTESEKIQKMVNKKMPQLCAYTPMIHINLIQLFYHILECTDLKNMPIPSEEIMSPEKHKFTIGDKRQHDLRRRGYENPFEAN
jgi:hypothetical protein